MTSLDEIRKLKLKYPSGLVSSEGVPTLRELLEAGQERIVFLIELKGDAALHFPEILSIVEESGSRDQVLFWITWKLKFAELFERHLESGMDEVSSKVVWRVKNLEEYEDVIERFESRIVDLKPSWDALSWEDHLFMPPREHEALVDHAVEQGTLVLVSRVSSDSYLRTLREKGVRISMSRAPLSGWPRSITVCFL